MERTECHYGATLKDSYPLILTAERPFTYTSGNSVSTSPFINGRYYVSLFTASDVTVDDFCANVQHDDGFGKNNRYIYLKPGNFNYNDYFYIDKSLTTSTPSRYIEKIWPVISPAT